jgi:hypothetical protein
MTWARFILACALACAPVCGCDLNPQPHPPLSDGNSAGAGSSGGASSSGGVAVGAGAPGLDAGVDAGPVNVGFDGGSFADAESLADASPDGPSGDAPLTDAADARTGDAPAADARTGDAPMSDASATDSSTGDGDDLGTFDAATDRDEEPD